MEHGSINRQAANWFLMFAGKLITKYLGESRPARWQYSFTLHFLHITFLLNTSNQHLMNTKLFIGLWKEKIHLTMFKNPPLQTDCDFTILNMFCTFHVFTDIEWTLHWSTGEMLRWFTQQLRLNLRLYSFMWWRLNIFILLIFFCCCCFGGIFVYWCQFNRN